jgi:predicted ATPase/DNA-binding winged helix-turn-helix (wHTH) protein
MKQAAQTKDVISFGPFKLIAGERVLTRNGATVDLGARTLDTLIALVAHSNEVVTKRDLLAQIWPGVIVEEGSLRFQIANLRRALGDGEDGARYISTVAGRGYCFVAPITEPSEDDPAQGDDSVCFPQPTLPNRLIRMIGRTEEVRDVSTHLTSTRFVTIVGAGGVGKTTVAVDVAHALNETFDGAVVFVDLGPLTDASLVSTTLASLLGLPVQANDASNLVASLRNRRLLVVFDTCEHVIEAVAALACRIVATAPAVHILATSREALRVEGEHVYKLHSLACPPENAGLTATIVHAYPAAELFLERAAANGARLDLSDEDAATVADICRKLDGLPLAIELAAGRVEAYGLRRTAELLDQRLTRVWQGRRSAPPRQQTLRATLDWSYGLLSNDERAVLRQLSIFVGQFTIEQALAVVARAVVDEELTFAAIDSLVAKSMVAARPAGAMMRYRLLDITRAFALEMTIQEGEFADLARRHATYCRGWLEASLTEYQGLSTTPDHSRYVTGLANVRAALEWCFGENGDLEIGIRLAAAAAPLFSSVAMHSECLRWSERALLELDEVRLGTHDEMHLRMGVGTSLLKTRGSGIDARSALERSLAIAEARDDSLNQLRLLHALHAFHIRGRDCANALNYARRSKHVAERIANPGGIALAQYLFGYSLQLQGDVSGSRRELEAALKYMSSSRRSGMSYLGFHDNTVEVTLSRTLWLQGHPTEAVLQAQRTVRDVAVAESLISAVTVLLWTGNLQSAEEHINTFMSYAQSQWLGFYPAVGRGLRGQLAVHRGNAQTGIEHLEDALKELHAARYEVLNTLFYISLATGLSKIGRLDDALAVTEDTIRRINDNGELVYMPELLRVKAGVLLAMSQSNQDDARASLTQSLELSRRQGLRAWELRTAIDLGALLIAQARRAEARKLLRPVADQFVDGSEAADLQAAKRLLASLG